MKKAVPLLIVAAAVVGAFLVWRQRQAAEADDAGATEQAPSFDAFGEFFSRLFGDGAAAPAPDPAPATPADNGT